MKFQVTSADTSSTTANKNGSIWSTNTFFERLPSKKRRNSLVVEDTGRLTSRRSSVPNDAFISINDPFRNEGGIECLRFHRSTNDICEVDSIYESTVTSSFLGQTSDSFVFNGAKKLIPVNRKGSYQVNQNVQEAIDDEPSYLGFSNFDEIALNKPEEDYLNDDVTDSGVCSFSSNLQRRQHLQNLEMTDLGIPSLNPTGFTLANLRKKYNRALDKPKGGRYKWKTSLELVVAYLSFYQGCCSLVLPGNVSSKEIGAFFWIHALLMTSWALPLSYLLAIIGQFSGKGSLQVWKMVPVSWGIGLAYVVSMYVMSLVAATNVAYALYSFFLIIWNAHPHGKLPWKECTIQSSTSFMYDSCARESCQDQLRLRHSCEFWLQSDKAEDKLYEEGFGDPNWALSIALYGSWTLICLFTLKGMRVMSVLLYVSGILPIISLLVFLFLQKDLRNGSLPLKVLSIDPDNLLDLSIWIKAAGFTLKTIGLTVPILSCLCAYNRTHYKLDKLVPIIIIVNLIYTWISLTFNVAYDTGLDLDFALRMLNRFGDEGQLFSLLFLFYVMVTKFNAASVLTDSVITSLGDSIAWLANWRLLTSIIYAFVSFILALIFTVPNGWQMVLNTQKALEVSSVLLMPFLIFSIIFGYGLKALSDNVYIMSGWSISGLSKVWLVAFLPSALFPIMVSYFKSDGLLKLHTNFYANLHLFGIISIVVLIPVVYAMVLILRTYCQRNSIVALFRRTPGWPHETQTKPQFVHSASFERYRTRRTNVANAEEHDNLAMSEL